MREGRVLIIGLTDSASPESGAKAGVVGAFVRAWLSRCADVCTPTCVMRTTRSACVPSSTNNDGISGVAAVARLPCVALWHWLQGITASSPALAGAVPVAQARQLPWYGLLNQMAEFSLEQADTT